MEIPIKQIEDRDTKVIINNGESRIDQIKSEIRSFNPSLCRAEVYEMWEDE